MALRLAWRVGQAPRLGAAGGEPRSREARRIDRPPVGYMQAATWSQLTRWSRNVATYFARALR